MNDPIAPNPSSAQHRAYLRRLGIGLLAALLTALALGGLAFPSESSGSVTAALAAGATPPGAAGRTA
jgi:hypothetical protein